MAIEDACKFLETGGEVAVSALNTAFSPLVTLVEMNFIQRNSAVFKFEFAHITPRLEEHF